MTGIKFKPFTLLRRVGVALPWVFLGLMVLVLFFLLPASMIYAGVPWYLGLFPWFILVLGFGLAYLIALFEVKVWKRYVTPWWARQIERERNK